MLSSGNYVVHRELGLGIWRGSVRRSKGSFFHLEFAHEANVLVPARVSFIGTFARYSSPSSRRFKGPVVRRIDELTDGQLVVHRDLGIAAWRGVQQHEGRQSYCIEFARGATIRLPVQVTALSRLLRRYEGPDADEANLDQLPHLAEVGGDIDGIRELAEGEFAVHRDCGVGVWRGRVDGGGFRIEFGDTDALDLQLDEADPTLSFAYRGDPKPRLGKLARSTEILFEGVRCPQGHASDESPDVRKTKAKLILVDLDAPPFARSPSDSDDDKTRFRCGSCGNIYVGNECPLDQEPAGRPVVVWARTGYISTSTAMAEASQDGDELGYLNPESSSRDETDREEGESDSDSPDWGVSEDYGD